MDSSPYSDRVKRPELQSRSESEHFVPVNPRRKYKRRGTGDSQDNKDSGSEDEDKSIMSDSSEHELDRWEDSDGDVDEETGLPVEERRKFIRHQRRKNRLDARIGGQPAGISKDEQREADKNVMHKLIVNAVLIGFWYLFSLSISIVSLGVKQSAEQLLTCSSTTNGCFRLISSTSAFLYSRPRSICSCNSFSPVLSSWRCPRSDQFNHKTEMLRQPNRSSHRYSILLAWFHAVQRPPSISVWAIHLCDSLH